jgi:hypothetical protein
MTDQWIIAPPDGCTCLPDGRHELAWVVGPDGEQWPIIRDTEVTGIQRIPIGAAMTARIAPHETTAPLNSWWRARLATAGMRRGRPRLDGRPCRTPVSRPGAACHHHRNHDTPHR